MKFYYCVNHLTFEWRHDISYNFICKHPKDSGQPVQIRKDSHQPAPASVAQLDAPSNWRPGGHGFNPRRGRQHSFVEIDHEIFSTVILSLPIQEGQFSVSGERMCTILVNRLEVLACPVNVWLGKLTARDMTPLGWLGHKTSTNRSACTSMQSDQSLHLPH